MAASARAGEDTAVIPLDGRLPGMPESTRRHLDRPAALGPVLRVPRGTARTDRGSD